MTYLLHNYVVYLANIKKSSYLVEMLINSRNTVEMHSCMVKVYTKNVLIIIMNFNEFFLPNTMLFSNKYTI